MFYAYHVGNEIGKEAMHGRDARAALGWRCREQKPRQVRAMAALLERVRRWLAGGAKVARAGSGPAAREGRLLPR